MSVSPKSPRGQSALSTSNGDGQADIIRRLYQAGAWLAYEPDDCAHGPYNGPLSLEESDVADFLIDPDIVIAEPPRRAAVATRGHPKLIPPLAVDSGSAVTTAAPAIKSWKGACND